MESPDKPSEVPKDDENSKVQAAVLLGSSGADPQSQPKRRKSNFKIIIGVLLLCLLIIILAVVFALKQRCNSEAAASSCRRRCVSERGDASAACHCDPACVAERSCCLDYQEVCVAPMRLWTCTKFRCGEQLMAGRLCSCSDECAREGNCCSNYRTECHGELPWVEEPCPDLDSLQCPASFLTPPVILVSLDGFRAGYLEAYSGLLPVISKLKNCGTSTPYMRPAYPTKTFPNHYTIVTGLYPESHGIVDNKMYDVTRNASFSLKSVEKFNAAWYQGEPVWITAARHKLRSGTFFWPGSDVAFGGIYPDYYKVYNKSVSFERRVTTILEWLDLPEGKRPHFYTLYLEEPDGAGHRYGPMSSQVIEALLKVDRILGMLMDGLKQRHLHRCVNLVVLSDHGMEEASCAKAAYVSSYQDNIEDFTVIQGPAARIRPRKIPEEFFTFDYEGLVRNLSCRAPDQAMKPYLKEHLPKRFHFANNVRIERAHLYMQSQWQAALKPGEMKYCSGGFHGSDNLFKNMQAIFMAYGPWIKSRTVVPPFENIEVYNLLCDLLRITPAPNNGTHGSLTHVLRRPVYRPVYPAERSAASPCIARSSTVTDSLGCHCPSLSSSQEEELNQKLINSSSSSALRSLHLPYGIPRVLQENAQFCVLQHSAYINGYSKDLLMPLWVAYTMDTAQDVQPLQPVSGNCVRADVRVPPAASQTCIRYRNNSSPALGLLHPPNLGTKDAEFDSLLTSNMVPMFPPFKDVWAHIHDVVLQKYLRERSGLNVMSGPIFDQNYDGNYDIPKTSRPNEAAIPTHFFLILTSCRNSSFTPQLCTGPLDALSFVLPHRPDTTEACSTGSDMRWVEDWMQFHVARVRDVELLTGLSFYQDQLSIIDILQLKTYLHTF